MPRTPVTVVAGPPIDLSRWAGATPTTATLGEITEHIMLVLRDMVAEIRGGTPPPLWQRRAKRPLADSSAPSAPSSDVGGLAVGIPEIKRVAVLGAGSWGTAFAKVLADAGRSVVIWARREEVAESIRRDRRNPDYLPERRAARRRSPPPRTPAGRSTAPTWSAIAVPSHTLRDNLAEWVAAGAIGPDATLVSLMKGIELGTGKRMSEVIAEVAGVDPAGSSWSPAPTWPARSRSGSRPRPSSPAPTRTGPTLVQQAVATPYFRPYTNDDVIGCELGGAVKNVIALACGMAIGMGFGDNTKATLITRGLAETARLGVRARRRPADLRRAGRAGRPGRHLHVADVAQPDVRRAPGPGRHAGAGPGRHPADRRGREELSVHSGPGPRARGRDADHRAGRAGVPRGRDAKVAMTALMCRETKPE